MNNVTSRGLLVVWFEIPAETEEEFNDWYNTEHIPQREVIPGILSARRFIAVEGEPRYLAIYDLEQPDVMHSPAYLNIIGEHETPWTRRIRRKATLLKRSIYQQILPAPGSGLWVTSPGSAERDHLGRALLLEAADISPEREAEFNHWYDQEHVRGELANPGFRAARRFKALEGQPSYLALYELDSVDVLSTEAYSRVSDPGQTAATTHMLPWQQAVQCAVYAQIYPPPGHSD